MGATAAAAGLIDARIAAEIPPAISDRRDTAPDLPQKCIKPSPIMVNFSMRRMAMTGFCLEVNSKNYLFLNHFCDQKSTVSGQTASFTIFLSALPKWLKMSMGDQPEW